MLSVALSVMLTACGSPSAGMKAKGEPVSLQKVEEVQLPVQKQDEDTRIAALEREVIALKNEVIAARPKIAKIDVMEQKFKDLSLGLDRIDATYNVRPEPAPVAAVPVTIEKPLPPVVKAAAPAPPIAPPVKVQAKPPVKSAAPAAPKGGKVVKDLRIGEQSNGTRLVLDLGQATKVKYDIDNEEKILLIDIPGYKWDAAKSGNLTKSALVSSYQVTTDDKGSHLVLQLKKPARVSNSSTINATAGKSPRAVVDISPQ